MTKAVTYGVSQAHYARPDGPRGLVLRSFSFPLSNLSIALQKPRYYFYMMNLREEILREHSKTQAVKIAKWIGDSPMRYAELAKLFLEGEYRLTQRAAWILSHSGEVRGTCDELRGKTFVSGQSVYLKIQIH